MHVTSASNATPKSTTTNCTLVFPHCGAGHYFSKTGNHNHFFDSKWGYKPYTDPEQVEGWDEEKILTDFISDFKKDCELPFHRYNENPDFYTDEGLEVPSKSMKTEHILIEYLKRVTNNHYSIEGQSARPT
jgi:hypothetical protein